MTREELTELYGTPAFLPEYVDKKANASIIKNIIFCSIGIIGFAGLVVDGIVKNSFTTVKSFIGLIFIFFVVFFTVKFIKSMAHALRNPGICWMVKVISCEKRHNVNRGFYYKAEVKFPNGYIKKCSTKIKYSEGEYAYFYTKENDEISLNDKQLIEYIFKKEE